MANVEEIFKLGEVDSEFEEVIEGSLILSLQWNNSPIHLYIGNWRSGLELWYSKLSIDLPLNTHSRSQFDRLDVLQWAC